MDWVYLKQSAISNVFELAFEVVLIMGDVTQILSAIQSGDRLATNELLPLVYEELRRLAARKMAREKSGQTLQTTALVHEAYLRLVGDGSAPAWDSRIHFFAAAAEAMRRILVENARSKLRLKRGGQWEQVDLDSAEITIPGTNVDILALDEALEKLAQEQPQKAQLVKLRFFAGLTIDEVAQAMDISTATAGRIWRYARTWLVDKLADNPAADCDN
jgi:RNA polymerase sigma factor (TIGR02999 family)